MEHNITRKVSGYNIDDYIQPVCSCGWQRQKHYGYDDFQMNNLQAEEHCHLFLLNEHQKEISNDHHD